MCSSQKRPVESNARPVNNSPPPGTTLQVPMPGRRAKKECKCPGVARGGGWAMLELTDALALGRGHTSA
jgi:hypothetical protein